MLGELRRLRLHTGAEVHALVSASGAEAKSKCLLLHGNPGSLSDWQRVMAELSQVAAVAAIDLPGFGQSPRPGPDAESLSLDRLADHVLAAADALGWQEPFFIVGHSHGGGVAQVAAVRHPNRIAGLVLIATLGTPAHDSYRLLAAPGAAAVVAWAGRLFRVRGLRPLSRLILRGFMKDIFSPEQASAAKIEEQLQCFADRPELLLSMVQVAKGRPCAHLAALAKNIRCPVLFLHGQNDALVPPRHARAIHDLITAAGGRSQFQPLAAFGHMLIDFQASQVVRHITRFLNAAPAVLSENGSSL